MNTTTDHQEPFFLIGLTGQAGTGKDTVRQILTRKHDFYGLAFADPIRAMLEKLLRETGIGTHWMHVRELKEQPIDGLGVSYRHMAQTLGTEWGRALRPDFWLRLATENLHAHAERGHSHFVISDVRFQNEVDWVRAHGGVVWRVERQQAQPVRHHASESEIAQFDVDAVIANHGGLADLDAAVHQALKAFA